MFSWSVEKHSPFTNKSGQSDVIEMDSRNQITHNGEVIKVYETNACWELEYPNGSKDKIFHHINAEQDAVWMWECGRIDEAALTIGNLIEEIRLPT
jgi:hypothetical protein